MKNLSTKCLEGKIFLFAFPSPQTIVQSLLLFRWADFQATSKTWDSFPLWF